MLSVSMVFPCYQRGKELRRTLKSIREQKYPGSLELIVVEDGNDGITESVAAEFDARFIRRERVETYPAFQSPGLIRNIGLKAAKNEILILQDADIFHETPNTVEQLVNWIKDDPSLMSVPLVRRLHPDGSFFEWFNHPTEGPRPRWILGGCARTVRREAILAFGGYEEAFFGHGFEDDFFDYLVRHNGIKIEYVPTAITAHAHEWADGSTFEPLTGLANWALILTLLSQIIYFGRPVLANIPISQEENVERRDIESLLDDAVRFFRNEEYVAWARKWISGGADLAENRESIFIAARAQHYCLDLEKIRIGYIAEHVAHAAWSFSWVAQTLVEESRALQEGKTTWAARIRKTRSVYATWCSTALKIVEKILDGEEIKR
jgi:GT2 family glycosyltransferase